ncbi:MULTISPECIES: helix-turn-helix domain-containing protein [unclassified Neorhizobium]|uniref:helix-turn-helix domain-containing protein n=1 Tax=unclassified Neorhizobium TaxID=2629175 RepID=UPI001FF2ED8C|nr:MULTISPECIES: helix-turn-helix transcriptional regulator [unclassified Neorhizobium]MCJ9673280.1 helix-turn-helix domain-containing protein [Neorhizobium sp. SHOUNA12B]MCJ9748678.1 helix-turn-helix domain-containing protein [Neorhizobium sp. SHOUNA12A]
MSRQPVEVDRQVGSRIRQARLMRGVSQVELSARIGVTFQQLQKYEKGANRVSASKLVAISDALDVDTSYFFQDMKRERREEPTPDQVPIFSKQGRDLIEAFHRIDSNTVRRRIVGLVQQVAACGELEDEAMEEPVGEVNGAAWLKRREPHDD